MWRQRRDRGTLGPGVLLLELLRDLFSLVRSLDWLWPNHWVLLDDLVGSDGQHLTHSLEVVVIITSLVTNLRRQLDVDRRLVVNNHLVRGECW